MRKLAGFAAIAALAFGATAVMAASPSPSYTPSASPTASAKPSAKPSATPAPSASPSPSASPTTGTSGSSSAATTTWTAQVTPVQITGSVAVHELKSGGGTVTFKLSDLLNETAYSVRIDRGTIAGQFTRDRLIVARFGDDVTHFMNDAIQIHLSKTEMSGFLAARKASGVVVFISDGSRLSVAKFPPA
jgi:hypothetical protein